jgi:hypothetical protein
MEVWDFPKLSAILMAISSLGPFGYAQAQDFWEETTLYDVNAHSVRSGKSRSLAVGGYELSNGEWQSFRGWYLPRISEVNILLLTEIKQNVGLIWGVSTGGYGEKYSIQPGVWVGVVSLWQISEQASLTVSAKTLLGGRLSEEACIADYGDVGGIQKVNCRLAASILEPNETLDYLVNDIGMVEAAVGVEFTYRF